MIEKPVLLIGCPRAGTTLLYQLLSEIGPLWSIGFESKAILERYHHPRSKNWESGALDAIDLTAESRVFMLRAFERSAASGTFWRRVNRSRRVLNRSPTWGWIKRRGRIQAIGSAASSSVPQAGLDAVRRFIVFRNWLIRPAGGRLIRLLEKTPENCLRLPFLEALFPDAKVVYLVRDGRANVSSLMEGWRQPHLFPGYQVPEKVVIPGVDRDRWAFTLIPGWRDLLGRTLEEICAWQWIRCNSAVLNYLEAGKLSSIQVKYEDLIHNPGTELAKISEFIGIDFDQELKWSAGKLPRVNIVSDPGAEKWRKNLVAIQRIEPLLEPLMKEFGYLDQPSSTR